MNDSRLFEIQSALGNADNFINQQEPDQAIGLLKGIQDLIEFYPETSESVEFSLLWGEALSAKDDSLAEDYLREAEEKANHLQSLSLDLQIRPPEHLGDFYARSFRTLSLARSAFERAKAIAVEHYRKYDIDRIQLKITRVDLERKKELVELENFRTLKRVGKDKVYTWSEQLMAWNQHIGPGRAANALVARGLSKVMSEDYFLGLLLYVRNPQKDFEQPSLFL